VFSASARGDLAALDKEVRAREQSIRRKAKRLLSGSRQLKAQAAKENHNLENMAQHSPERRNTFGGPSGDGEEDPLAGESFRLEAGLQASVAPRVENKWLKLARSALSKSNQPAREEGGVDSAPNSRALSQLMATIQQSKEIARMLVQPYLVLVVGSSSQQNLGPRLRRELVPSFQRLCAHDDEEVLSLAYISGSKIEAVEDAVTFAPRLFRLQKSIILSEPSESPFATPATSASSATYHAAQTGRNPGGRALTLPEWYAEMEETRREAAGLREGLLATEVAGSAAAVDKANNIKSRLAHVEQRQKALLRQKPSGEGLASTAAGWAQLGGGPEAGFQATAGSLGGTLGKRQTGLSRAVTSLVRRAAAEGRGATEDLVDKEGGQQEPTRANVWGPRAMAALGDTQWTSSDPGTNRMLRNYGTMLDFFDYSGVSVQVARRLADLTRPPALGFKLLPDAELRAEFEQVLRGGAGRALPKSCNLFAVAKVGTPNMIFPSTLDVTFKNFQDPEQYTQLSDYFFPENAKSQLTVIVIRPVIVQNGMNDLFVEILKANDFLVIER